MERAQSVPIGVRRVEFAADADRIPLLSHREAMTMATVELERFLALVDQLNPEDSEKPTVCSRWNTRQIVAHLAGTSHAYSDLAEFRRQGSSRQQRPYRNAGMSRLEAMNQVAVDDRAGCTLPELIATLQEHGPRAIRTRQRLPAALRRLPLPLGKAVPELGRTWIPLGYLTDVILTRDMWMHRLDISRATGRKMVLTPQHDGRITELVVRDLARSLAPKLSAGVVYALAGPAGGTWRVGREVQATVHLDALDFHLLASGRMTPDVALSRTTIAGDRSLAGRAIDATVVPY